MKFKELTVILLILIISVIFYLTIFLNKQKSDYVVVKNLNKDEILFKIPLNKDGYYTVKGDYGNFNISIINGIVKAKNVDCPNKICEMGFLSKDYFNLNNIICIPNGIEIYIEEK